MREEWEKSWQTYDWTETGTRRKIKFVEESLP